MLRIAGWGCVVLLAVLSLLPADDMVRTGIGGRIEHAMAYAGTALLLGLAYPGLPRIAAALVAYAALLEALQNLSPGRGPAVADWLASSAGVLIGVAAARATITLCPPMRAIRPESETGGTNRFSTQ